MKLYYGKGACSLAVRIVLHELAVPCEFVKVDLKTKKTELGENFLSINPRGMVPVLITDQGQTLTENVVIQQYLADRYSAINLLPPAPDFRRYQILECLNFITTEVHKTASHLFNPKFSDELKENYFIPLFKDKLRFLDQRLEDKRYLMGDAFTLPDGYLFVVLSWLPLFKITLDDFNHFERYQAELKKRPAIIKSLQEEGLVSGASVKT